MTILNIHLDKHRALIATNTDGIRIDGSRGTISKLYSFPHVNAVLCPQGQMVLGFNIFMDLHLSMKDFDAMAKMLEGSARARFSALQDEAAQSGVRVKLDSVVTLVGWSSSKQCMTFWYCSMSMTEGVSVKELDQHMVSPWSIEAWGQPDDIPSTQEGMIEIARQQAQANSSLTDSCQGDLILAEVTRDSIVMKMVREFWK